MWGSSDSIPDLGKAVWVLLAAVVASWIIALWWWDTRHRRLPDWLTLPAAAISLALFSVSGMIWALLYVGLALTRGGIGGGDIKLAISLGMICAAAGGALAVFAAIAMAAVWTLVYALTLRLRGEQRPPAHGPGMLLGCAAACAWAPLIV